MEQVYIFMLFVFLVLAVIDLVVGVSNDAANFLNSAVGSKVATIRTIMIVASVGVAIGAMFSSGMMEIARKGIFNPELFYFNEVMVIFMSVILADILLFDLFNSIGLPTSTTVSIVFELLGAAMCVATIKTFNSGESLLGAFDYINTGEAGKIIMGIFTSVAIAFTVGTAVQYLARLIFSFKYQEQVKYVGGVFGGLSLTGLTYFIVFKGLKDVAFIPKEAVMWMDNNIILLLIGCFIFFSVLSQVLIRMKINIFRVIILSGTFALAMAFAGNDLVNFIGVPVAAYQSYDIWHTSGEAHNGLLMNALSDNDISTPTAILLLTGFVMILTLWFSKKARHVIDTGVNLSRQSEGGDEKFSSNFLSRFLVRITVICANGVNYIMPKKLSDAIDRRFEKPEEDPNVKEEDLPAFDLVRAAINLVVSSSLIAIGTSFKLPLSTTYVTFMVAMGSSLADRAWGRDSAVYRVAGVLNVIGGWFLTAIVAFIGAFLVAGVLYYGSVIGLILMIMVVGFLLIRNAIAYRNKQKAKAQGKRFERADLATIGGVIKESSTYVSETIFRIDQLYSKVVKNLGTQDLGKLTKNKKNAKKLEKELDELKGNVYYFIKSLNESSVASSKFYILILDYLQDMAQCLTAITLNSYEHVNNNHKNLKFNQLRDLKYISDKMESVFKAEAEIFKGDDYNKLTPIFEECKELKDQLSKMVQKQIDRIRTTETSHKTTKLYFSILLETNALIRANNNLLMQFDEYQKQQNKKKKVSLITQVTGKK
ncbi:inorganic phosphate transporter [Capnocytophaga sp. oral taxon 878]|uniref:inorganic phosphate transporter n=1 Tax=Capnocytophaga sp. oral taxon 878 TaxID=1316596 RepID=UPI000D022FCD|nr:inorganic phosphate transporter [Capnocytophaga sp. oral taxon 878]AVM50540.1 phosphate:sodium symporter [Capnocytophaga sp. oral taxon 878]